MKRLIELFTPLRLVLALLVWPSSGMATIASAFQSGSGGERVSNEVDYFDGWRVSRRAFHGLRDDAAAGYEQHR